MANTRLTRTPSSAGSYVTNTWSFWIKRGKLGSDQVLFGAYVSSTNKFRIRFNSNDTLQVGYYAGQWDFEINTSRVFRDTSSWYHIVIAQKASESTSTDRIKFYVNGVRETSFGTTNFPDLNEGSNVINATNATQNIGSSGAPDAYFDGSMSHVHFADGSALAPTVFGSVDSVTGEWQINTSPSFTPGTNGFTILKDGNTITDQSANSNNFSTSGAGVTNTKDCPSNVFNVFSDTTSKKAYTSEAGLKVSETATSWNLGVGGTIGASSGKYYWEFYKTANSDNFIAGIIPSAEFHRLAESTAAAVYNATNAIQIGASTSWWYKIGTGDSTAISGYGHGSGSKSSGLFQFALDLTNKKMWIGKDGTWYNSGNPATGANPLWTGSAVFPDDIYIPYWQGYGTVSGRFNFGGGSFGSDAVASAGTNASGNGVFERDVPAGFTALSTKGLNL